jgi:hypothetical protein
MQSNEVLADTRRQIIGNFGARAGKATGTGTEPQPEPEPRPEPEPEPERVAGRRRRSPEPVAGRPGRSLSG